jgi:Bacteriophage clamp loader A subunit
MTTPFDFVNSINSSTKPNLMCGDDVAAVEAAYVPYVVNRTLSYFPDTVLYANEMNMLQPDNKSQYLYLLNSIRPAKRFAKWVKRGDQDDIDAVCEYFGYSEQKAQQALTVLTSDHIQRIKEKLQRGGNT